ncbi:Myosin type-2 heavy chain 1, partial [Coemansia spiralis]
MNAAPDSRTIALALKLLEHYTRGAKAWFEDADDAWAKGTLVQRTEDASLGVARLVFERDDAAGSTTAQLMAQPSPKPALPTPPPAPAMALHDEPVRPALARRMSVRAATADDLKRV